MEPVWRPDAPFRQYKETDETIWADGYFNGLNWPADRWRHVPGGPYVPTSRSNDHPDWIKYCELLAQHKERWLDAWWAGFTEQAKTDSQAEKLLTKLVVERIIA